MKTMASSNQERSHPVTFHFDCRHFLGDRPCSFHKKEGVRCADCAYHDPVTTRILIVKLGAMGDVLRTTSIQPALVKQYERPHITWITAPASVDLLRHHEAIDTLLSTVRAGDLVITLGAGDVHKAGDRLLERLGK